MDVLKRFLRENLGEFVNTQEWKCSFLLMNKTIHVIFLFSAHSWNPGPSIRYKGLIKANITWQQRALRVRLITPSLKLKETDLPHICIHIRLDARRKWNLWRRTSQVLHARYKIITACAATATTVRHQWMGHVLTYGKRMFQRYAQPSIVTFIDNTKAFNHVKNLLAGLTWHTNQRHRQRKQKQTKKTTNKFYWKLENN